ncbi:hypothetical protein V6N12_035846 [Hibiscus sabdariffa]|uniref:RNase H type-1 domain-containing protein n=1 Tax=Hibiscus sabdariffa TaxID=183260 RepID=A0ABR2EPC6_9ROSI
MVDEAARASTTLGVSDLQRGERHELQDVVIRWVQPPGGWFKLNIDGAVNRISRVAACCGVVRDHEGNCWLL